MHTHGVVHGLRIRLLDGTERIGLPRLALARSEPLPTPVVAVCERSAHFIALLVRSAYTDCFELMRRTVPMTLAGEPVWGPAPPLVLAAEDVMLSALLEPCHDIGGDGRADRVRRPGGDATAVLVERRRGATRAISPDVVGTGRMPPPSTLDGGTQRLTASRSPELIPLTIASSTCSGVSWTWRPPS